MPGALAQIIRDVVQPGFEQDHAVKLIVEEATSGEQLTRLRAARGDSRQIVLMLDEMNACLARNEGSITRLDPREIPNLADVDAGYLLPGGFGVGLSASWVTLWYNSARLKEPPSSYADLWNRRYQKRVAVPSIKTTPGFQWLIVSAALASGRTPAEAQYDVEPGFEKWRQLGPNLHSTYDSFQSVTQLLAQGEVWLGFGSGRQVAPYIMQGAPIERANVHEKGFLGINSLVIPNRPSLAPLGRDLVNRLLSPEAQRELVRLTATAPVNRRVQVPPELANVLPTDLGEARSAIQLDWDHVNRQRAAWTERWLATVAG